VTAITENLSLPTLCRVNCRREIEELKAQSAQLHLQISQYTKETQELNMRYVTWYLDAIYCNIKSKCFLNYNM